MKLYMKTNKPSIIKSEEKEVVSRITDYNKSMHLAGFEIVLLKNQKQN